LADDELRFILKHELVHYKRKDLYYKFLVLIATAIHWFNPFIYLIERAINAQCELSCDAEVILGADADTRQHYSEAIIGVVKYHSKIRTALSTNFYGGKKGMKNRISSIMDTRKKRLGTIIISLVLVATLCTGFVFAASAYAATNNGNSEWLWQNAETTITVKDQDGNGIHVNNSQLLRPAGMFKVEDDGSITQVRDKWVDAFYDRMGVPESPSFFEREELKDGEMTSYSITLTDGSYLGTDPAKYDIAPPQRTYTDAEWAQILADIESGKLQPSGQVNADGTFTLFNNPNNPFIDRRSEGAVLTEITLSFDGEDFVFGEDKIVFGD